MQYMISGWFMLPKLDNCWVWEQHHKYYFLRFCGKQVYIHSYSSLCHQRNSDSGLRCHMYHKVIKQTDTHLLKQHLNSDLKEPVWLGRSLMLIRRTSQRNFQLICFSSFQLPSSVNNKGSRSCFTDIGSWKLLKHLSWKFLWLVWTKYTHEKWIYSKPYQPLYSHAHICSVYIWVMEQFSQLSQT